jgi:GNAT superfamily N-acetyltransferase
VRVVSTRYAELPAERRAYLEEIAEAEFGQYALVRETEWAEPDWSFQVFEGESFAAFHNIILRTVRIDGIAVRAAGLNNVITLAAYRGRGVASHMLRETQPRWFEMFEVDCGMLLCADPLVPFYAGLGWKKPDAKVMYEQPSGVKTWPANCMVLKGEDSFAAAREIDLRGLPW